MYWKTVDKEGQGRQNDSEDIDVLVRKTKDVCIDLDNTL